MTLPQARVVGVAVAALAAAVYANALAHGLVWDDPIILTRQLLAFHGVGDLLLPPRNIPQFSPDYYRPLTILSYLIDRAIGGSGPFAFHLSVVLFHTITTYLVFRVGLVLFARQSSALPAAGLGAALFAVHPIHTESVAWGAGRSDVLACGFVLAAVLAYRHDPWTAARRATVAAALTLAALLAKETAVAVLALLPASDAILGVQPSPAPLRGRAERRRQRDQTPSIPTLRQYTPFGVVLLVYVTLRQLALGNAVGPAAGLDTTVVVKLIAAVGLYIGKLLLPVQQSAYISDLPTGAISLLSVCAGLGATAYVSVVAWRRGERRVPFLVFWVGVTLAPSLAIVAKIPAAPVAERYLYLPSVGFCLLLGYGAVRASQSASRYTRPALIAIGAIILGACTVATVRRNTVWRSNLSLWQDTAAKNLTDGLPMRGLATAYQQRGDAARAAHYFQLALQRRNDRAGQVVIYNNLGSLAMAEKKLDEAERDYRAALTANPQAADALFNLGLIALTRAKESGDAHDVAGKQTQAGQALQHFEQAAQLSPLDPDIQVALGQASSALDNASAARTHYQRALQLGLPPATAASVRQLLAELP